MKKTWKILLVISGCFAVIAASGAAYYTIVTQDAVLDEKKLVISDDKIEIFDANGRAVKDAAAFSPKETFRLDSLSEKVKFAFVDTEDKRFYDHDGFDYKRIVLSLIHI